MAVRHGQGDDLAALFQRAADVLRDAPRDLAGQLRALERVRDRLAELERTIERRIVSIERALG
jgi:hypothetical protein